ncbi:hypothetical protein E2C01_021846 [Portunus trituberculatus]|uniref:Uncharacterized protein n=1 Tax=Portunus trituberculatus TaxID=210409 RepID=A0A5B7E5P0_PORTR|nr:hypothetical protein [Portunus trituberculatus]
MVLAWSRPMILSQPSVVERPMTGRSDDGIRVATGAFRTSPIPSLLVDADWFRTHRLPDSVPCVNIAGLAFASIYHST